MRLDGRVAIVTGAANGLGRAEAIALAESGADVVLNDLDAAEATAVADEIAAAGAKAVVCAGDVGDFATGRALVDAAVDSFGRLDVLVNNAGVLRDRMVFTMSEEEWDTVIRVHLRGHFTTTRFATAYWRSRSKAGDRPDAAIVNTASEAFLLGSDGQPNYAAAKAGIAALTVATARSCARYGVRANAICPRARTDMTAAVFGAPPAAGPDPLDPAHVAPLVVYLATSGAHRITGHLFVAHGTTVQVMAPPSVAETFTTADRWTVESLHEALGDRTLPSFSCEETFTPAREVPR